MTLNPWSLYKTQYLGAVELMEQDRIDECVKEAKHNLTEPALSRYWRCKNLILISSVHQDWYRAERYRRKAEDSWQEVSAGTRETETGIPEVLRELRIDLDHVKADLDADWPEDFDESYVYEHDDEEEDEGWVDETRTAILLEDAESVHRAEERVFGTEEAVARGDEEAAAAERAARLESEAKEWAEAVKKAAETTKREDARREAAFAEASRWVKAEKAEEEQAKKTAAAAQAAVPDQAESEKARAAEEAKEAEEARTAEAKAAAEKLKHADQAGDAPHTPTAKG